jgi:hypothetical protein
MRKEKDTNLTGLNNALHQKRFNSPVCIGQSYGFKLFTYHVHLKELKSLLNEHERLKKEIETSPQYVH